MTKTSFSTMPQGVSTANSVYFPALDGLRALALAMVFIDHYIGIGIFGVGVNVFFVLSGFLITGILLDTRDEPHRLRNFYVRRTLRIFPLYYAIFLLLLLLTPVMHWRWNSAWILWPAYLGNFVFYMPEWLVRPEWMLVSNGQLVGANHVMLQLGHFWTLCVEEQFYLLWPWFVFTRSRKTLFWLCGIVIVVLPFLRIFAAHVFPPAAIRANVLFRTLPFQMDSLLLGALLALVLRSQYRSELLRWGRIAANVLALVTLVYVYCRVDLQIAALHQPFVKHFGPLIWQTSVVNIVSGAVILNLLRPASWMYRIFNLRPLRCLGRISYGAYIFHNIPHEFYVTWAERITVSHVQLVTSLIAIVMTLLLSTLSYRFFETPFLRLKDRWTIRA
jgi:peptidoglycan/LPS O-acetylase OafA/YrhL